MFQDGFLASAEHHQKFFPMFKGVIVLADQKANKGKLELG
jgi:hypothetical protein